MKEDLWWRSGIVVTIAKNKQFAYIKPEDKEMWIDNIKVTNKVTGFELLKKNTKIDYLIDTVSNSILEICNCYISDESSDSEIYEDISFKSEYQKQFSLENIRHLQVEKIKRTQKSIKHAKRQKVTKRIRELPESIQTKILVYAIKNYYRYIYKPFTMLPPSWIEYSNYITKETSKTIFNNVHFLHLEFNTLPENKQWIPGCQCEYCLSVDDKHEDTYMKLMTGEIDQTDISFSLDEGNFWNQNYFNISDTTIRIYDPLYNKNEHPQYNPNIISEPLTFSNLVVTNGY
jgi:hypothetical protein